MKMTGARLKTALIAISIGAALMSYQNCSGPQGFRYKGQPGMLDRGDGFLQQNGGTTTDNPKPTLTIQVGNFENVIEGASLAPKILLCVSQIRFEKASNGADDTRMDMSNGKFLELRPEGTVLDMIDVPVGNYERIRLRLRGNCENNVIASVTNANGTILLREDVDMEFSGAIVNNGNLSRLILDMDSIVANLAKAKNARDVQEALEEEGSCGGD